MNTDLKTSVQIVMTAAMLCVVSFPYSTVRADDDQPNLQALYKQINALSVEVRQLRASQNETWLNERRVEEVRALIKEGLADAVNNVLNLESSNMSAP